MIPVKNFIKVITRNVFVIVLPELYESEEDAYPTINIHQTYTTNLNKKGFDGETELIYIEELSNWYPKFLFHITDIVRKNFKEKGER